MMYNSRNNSTSLCCPGRVCRNLARWWRWKHTAIVCGFLALVLMGLLQQQNQSLLLAREEAFQSGYHAGSGRTPPSSENGVNTPSLSSKFSQRSSADKQSPSSSTTTTMMVTKESLDQSETRVHDLEKQIQILQQEKQQAQSDLALKDKELLSAQESARLPIPSLPPPNPSPKNKERNPLGLPPYLHPDCNEADTILMQRYIIQRQHAYMETREQLKQLRFNTSAAATITNPDPDPYCRNQKLMIDSIPFFYVWSEKEMMDDIVGASNSRMEAGGGTTQKIIYPSFNVGDGQPIPRRQTGFGFAAQMHIIASRMIWAMQNGYTYVNLARLAFTKGMETMPAFTEGSANPAKQGPRFPYRHDRKYWDEQRPSDLIFDGVTCERGGLDCFFMPHASLACIERAKQIETKAKRFPPLNSFMRDSLRKLEQAERALINPNLEDHLHSTTWVDPYKRKVIADMWQDSLLEADRRTNEGRRRRENLPRSFEMDLRADKDPYASTSSSEGPTPNAATSIADDPHWAAHSKNPFSLPGLNFDVSWSSHEVGDKFLMSEVLRFLMRPTPLVADGFLNFLRADLNYPGFITQAGYEPVLREGSFAGVGSIHVRRQLDARSQALVPIHKSAEYLWLFRRLIDSHGLHSAFVSSDAKTRVELFVADLGAPKEFDTTSRDRSPGELRASFASNPHLHMMHVPYDFLGEDVMSPPPVPAGRDASNLRAKHRFSQKQQAMERYASMKDREGLMHLFSLYTMSLFSGVVLGALSSHWDRMIVELQRWDDGQCLPSKYGWLFPPNSLVEELESSEELQAFSSEANGGVNRAQHFNGVFRATPQFNPVFVDMDGDTYFIGDYKTSKHPRIPMFNSPNLDPTVDE